VRWKVRHTPKRLHCTPTQAHTSWARPIQTHRKSTETGTHQPRNTTSVPQHCQKLKLCCSLVQSRHILVLYIHALMSKPVMTHWAVQGIHSPAHPLVGVPAHKMRAGRARPTGATVKREALTQSKPSVGPASRSNPTHGQPLLACAALTYKPPTHLAGPVCRVQLYRWILP
jgi:hypothetical protein